MTHYPFLQNETKWAEFLEKQCKSIIMIPAVRLKERQKKFCNSAWPFLVAFFLFYNCQRLETNLKWILLSSILFNLYNIDIEADNIFFGILTFEVTVFFGEGGLRSYYKQCLLMKQFIIVCLESIRSGRTQGIFFFIFYNQFLLKPLVYTYCSIILPVFLSVLTIFIALLVILTTTFTSNNTFEQLHHS